MRLRTFLAALAILGTVWHTAAAQPKKKSEVDAPAPETIFAGRAMQSDSVASDLPAIKPDVPLGPQDILKSYEIAMSLVAEKASTDFSVILQAQQTNQISREQAEYLLQQRYQLAMMQYQVLSALHDVLKHEVDEASQRRKETLKSSSSDTVLVVPIPGSVSAYR
jgi:parvulin-like peptidyl-prolyl isomerase